MDKKGGEAGLWTATSQGDLTIIPIWAGHGG